MSKSLEQFGVAADDTPLMWTVIKPAGPGPWPSSVIMHVGGWRSGSQTDAKLMTTARDLAAAGIICFSIGYRLSVQHVPGQTANCYWPFQTDDIKMAVKAARIDSRCNGKVGSVGGSAGATHSLSVACETTALGNEPWTPEDRPLAAICLSAATQFDDHTGASANWLLDVSTYLQSTDLAVQKSKSPTEFIDATCPPLFIVNAETEEMPINQYNSVCAKIDELGLADCERRLLPGSLHAFANWATVKDDATAWLLERLA